jgi:hypothetical protein
MHLVQRGTVQGQINAVGSRCSHLLCIEQMARCLTIGAENVSLNPPAGKSWLLYANLNYLTQNLRSHKTHR